MTPQDRIAAVETFIDRWRTSAGAIVIISPAPQDHVMEKCYTKFSAPIDCTNQITPLWASNAELEGELADRIGATFIDSREWFCSDGLCPPFVGTLPTRRDLQHATPEYQERLAPVIVEKLEGLGLLGG